MNHRREILRRTFDTVAELYDVARPRYSEEFIDDIFEMCGIDDRPPSILEVGCGTGQASVRLGRRGCELLCVELGDNMAQVARRNLAPYPNAEVVVTQFEDFNPGDRRFDIVFSVSAWHWIDPVIGCAKAASLLRPGGHLAIASVHHAFPEGFDPFFNEIQECYVKIGLSEGDWPPPPPDQVIDDVSGIETSGLFGPVQTKRTVWPLDFTANQYIDLLETFSGHIVMDPSKKERLYFEMRKQIAMRPSGTIRKHYLTILQVAEVSI